MHHVQVHFHSHTQLINMAHIHQIGTEGTGYTIVIAEGDLTQHPAIIERPDEFEIVDGEPPELYQKLDYQSI